ncbi:MAG: gamma carbonic anhydrase family protein [Burkholderiaceae bacterium]|nr:MAG: gamma carbonic anhydrase family protein [Burkholderiaceae bacterium]
MAVYQFENRIPAIDGSAFVADSASVIGSVTLAAGSSVWFGAVIRGDNEPITVGENSNVQEGTTLHTDPGFPCTIGNSVTIGHQAMLHGCTVGDGSLIGIQAVVLNGAVIGKNCLIGAGALVTEGKHIPDNSLVLGSPSKIVRQLGAEDFARMQRNAEVYVRKAQAFKKSLKKISD